MLKAGLVLFAAALIGGSLAAAVPRLVTSASALEASRSHKAVSVSAQNGTGGNVPVVTLPDGRTGFLVQPNPALPTLMGPDCAWQPTSAAAPAPGPAGLSIGRIPDLPSGLSDTVSSVFSVSCAPLDATQDEGTPLYLSLSMVEYSGSRGAVVVQTMQPTPAEVQAGLILENPYGTLPDGTPLYSAPVASSGPGAFANNLMFYKDGEIIQISGTVSLDQLRSLAADVTIS